eukprot:3584528-Pyramimonas_sp.AAC.1
MEFGEAVPETTTHVLQVETRPICRNTALHVATVRAKDRRQIFFPEPPPSSDCIISSSIASKLVFSLSSGGAPSSPCWPCAW